MKPEKIITNPPPRPRGRGTDILQWANQMSEWARVNRVLPGENINGRMTDAGIMLSARMQEVTTTHPFKLSAAFDDDTTPTVCLVSIAYGTLQGTVASGSSYPGVPLFEGSGGSRLDADPAPTYNVGVTDRTNYFYFKVLTDEYGEVDEVTIEHFVAADLPLTETPFVQPGFPDPSDVGTAGIYYWLLGTVSVDESAGVYSILINQGVETSLGFYTCGAGGRFYRS